MMSIRSCLLVSACLGAFSATPALAAPALWEVRDDDSAIWIFGSIHVLPEGTEWRTPLFNGVLADADKVVFETDISPTAVTTMTASAFAQGIYSDSTLLTDVIDVETEDQLRQSAAEYAVAVGPLLAMRPWLAASTISSAALTSLGYTAQGVEFVLDPELAPGRLAYLETGEEQLAVMTAATEAEQVEMLRSTLSTMPDLPKVMTKMVRSWMNGTPEQLAQMLTMETGGMDDAFTERLIYARNRNWIAPLKEMLRANTENLVIVGAGHLTGGGSVLELLEQDGYEVVRIQ